MTIIKNVNALLILFKPEACSGKIASFFFRIILYHNNNNRIKYGDEPEALSPKYFYDLA